MNEVVTLLHRLVPVDYTVFQNYNTRSLDQKRFLDIFPFGIIDDSEAYLLVTLVEVVIKDCY